MSYLSRPFYFTSISIGALVSVIGLTIITPPSLKNQAYTEMPSIAVLCYVLFLYVAAVQLVFYYKMWKALPPSIARTTPAKATWFMLIPVFQVYWGFQAVWGWTKDFNRFTREQNLDVPKAPERLALLVSILSVVGFIIGVVLLITHDA